MVPNFFSVSDKTITHVKQNASFSCHDALLTKISPTVIIIYQISPSLTSYTLLLTKISQKSFNCCMNITISGNESSKVFLSIEEPHFL